MQRTEFPFFHELRVRYSEIDSQGIVFNAHYLTYFDTALTEYMRHVGYDYQRDLVERGVEFHVVKSLVEYRRPVRYDERIDIGVCLSRVGRSSLSWALGVFGAGSEDLRASGEIVWVCAAVGSHQSTPVPADIVERLRAPGLKA
jgi:acyl-CoA thioester hydrolase